MVTNTSCLVEEFSRLIVVGCVGHGCDNNSMLFCLEIVCSLILLVPAFLVRERVSRTANVFEVESEKSFAVFLMSRDRTASLRLLMNFKTKAVILYNLNVELKLLILMTSAIL